MSSNDADASATVADVATQLGFAPWNLEGSIRAAHPFTFWAGGLAGFCFRIWLSEADCSSHLKGMLFREFN